MRRDDPHAALAHVERALNAEPNNVDALQLRALIRARMGNLLLFLMAIAPVLPSAMPRAETIPTSECLCI